MQTDRLDLTSRVHLTVECRPVAVPLPRLDRSSPDPQV